MLSVVIAGPERHPIPLGCDPMKSTVETLDDNRVKLSVEVDEETFDVAVDAAFKRIAKERDETSLGRQCCRWSSPDRSVTPSR